MRVLKQEKSAGKPHSPEPVDSLWRRESLKQDSKAQDWELKPSLRMSNSVSTSWGQGSSSSNAQVVLMLLGFHLRITDRVNNFKLKMVMLKSQKCVMSSKVG